MHVNAYQAHLAIQSQWADFEQACAQKAAGPYRWRRSLPGLPNVGKAPTCELCPMALLGFGGCRGCWRAARQWELERNSSVGGGEVAGWRRGCQGARIMEGWAGGSPSPPFPRWKNNLGIGMATRDEYCVGGNEGLERQYGIILVYGNSAKLQPADPRISKPLTCEPPDPRTHLPTNPPTYEPTYLILLLYECEVIETLATPYLPPGNHLVLKWYPGGLCIVLTSNSHEHQFMVN
ncbi:hypothetical protein BDN71DRAFT_1434486 [Pleurotus eryngii]|uniref:Uncharacterized protein n=1 Tax=Pleurotus eryngii TaxID=5323 RepID=A0A9P5ZMC2_PLEER|nr:hypothetical protein BDN71DRAFT_1434486 [Pleurotus eryngii]